MLINPHAFPSRMTIGMLIESLVSKAGAMAGKFMNATPFQKAAGHYQEPISSVADTLEQFGFHRNGGMLSRHEYCVCHLKLGVPWPIIFKVDCDYTSRQSGRYLQGAFLMEGSFDC